MRLAIGISDGPYRLRSAADTTWAPSYGYGQRVTLAQRLLGAIRAVLRTIIPVAVLSTALIALFLYMGTPVPYLEHSGQNWLTASNLLLAVPFLAIHLTNRRYGPAYAFAQIVLSFAALGTITVFGRPFMLQVLPLAALPDVREAAAFGTAFMLSGFLAIVAFDGARGPRWWSAPFLGSLIGALSFAPIFYPAAYAGTSAPWLEHMAVETGVLCAGALVMLLPYWMLRRLVQPLPGFGGY